MPNNHLSLWATNREFAQENRAGASSVRTSIREMAEHRLDQLGRYIRAACSSEEAKESNENTISFDEQCTSQNWNTRTGTSEYLR
jgi:hypothetical protein